MSADLLLEPMTLPFMRQALLLALLVAVPTALLSCLLVLKGWALMGDALSHAVLPGIVLAFMTGLPLALGAFAAGMACAGAAGYLKEQSRVKADTVLGVVFSAMFALGLILMASVETQLHLHHILFGDLLGAGPADLAQSALIGAVVTLLLLLFRRDFLLFAFDPDQARALGRPARLLHYGLLAMLSLAIVSALQASGIILTIALLVTPGATAFLVARRFGAMLAVAVSASSIAAVAGLHLSYAIGSAPAPTIVLCLTLFFLAALARALARGRVSRAPATRSAASP